jgi:hypothetical protein
MRPRFYRLMSFAGARTGEGDEDAVPNRNLCTLRTAVPVTSN